MAKQHGTPKVACPNSDELGETLFKNVIRRGDSLSIAIAESKFYATTRDEAFILLFSSSARYFGVCFVFSGPDAVPVHRFKDT